ncbi:hypothetical protein N2603_38785 [Bradyrhizobium huanghuaihaiense]|uniref:CmcJ/NvfI family oxidoreductase n=1 Tax=Bradyrhizobium huanghuaihaiense TaxID=990078 RepID=UPI0021AAF8D5|nr:CmcJ/NvfI family oxidoreductase [Bradyrhizobium sp. CB3035]UWU75842.1 hypothetical protein N2603_38785 [Bradyrhizobium sp. CB3035]
MTSAKSAWSTGPVNRDQLECGRGEIVFARRTPDEKAPTIVVPGHENYPMVMYDVPMRNARPIVDELSLDREGFILTRHKTSCADLRDPEVMREKYTEEMVPFIKNYFNASWVVPNRSRVHVRRAAGTALPKDGWNADTVRAPAGLAHVDFAPIAAHMLAAAENQVQGIPIRPYSRLMVIQAWRALSPPPQDFPLAFCDATTIRDTDFSVADYVSIQNQADSALKTSYLLFDPAQRWYYFPNMTPDELVLFKGYDSEEHYQPRSAHSAFDDRRRHPDAKPRESVEARFFVYYE